MCKGNSFGSWLIVSNPKKRTNVEKENKNPPSRGMRVPFVHRSQGEVFEVLGEAQGTVAVVWQFVSP